MRLTPLDIRKQEFTRGFRGYEPDEVNAFLQMVSNQWEEILDESRRKDDKIRDLESKMDHYEKVEEALQEALQTARDTSRKALQNAEDKARLIVDEAERRADDIKRDAEQDRHQIKRDTAKLSGRRSEIVSRLRAFLMSEMELLARFEGDDPVGFIKLLPAEERRVQQTAESRESGRGSNRESRLDESDEAHPTTTFASTQEPIPDDEEYEDRPAPSRPDENRAHDDDQAHDHDDNQAYDQTDARETERHGGDEQRPTEAVARGEGQNATSPADRTEGQPSAEGAPHTQDHVPREATDRTAGQTNEVMHGPGWTARTVISRPSEQSSSRPQPSPEVDEEEGGQESSRTSSDEIEKIRRILSDLD